MVNNGICISLYIIYRNQFIKMTIPIIGCLHCIFFVIFKLIVIRFLRGFPHLGSVLFQDVVENRLIEDNGY
jgi:hypothetical protein